jgi:hypothetical protein
MHGFKNLKSVAGRQELAWKNTTLMLLRNVVGSTLINEKQDSVTSSTFYLVA